MFAVEDRVAIEALHRAWLDAELRGDSEALLEFCTSAPVWLPPNEPPLCGKAEILRWLGEQPHAILLRIDVDDLAIAGIGSFAWKLATFRTTVESQADTKGVVVTGSHGWLLQRDDAGQWRVGVVTWTMASVQ